MSAGVQGRIPTLSPGAIFRRGEFYESANADVQSLGLAELAPELYSIMGFRAGAGGEAIGSDLSN